MNRAEEADFRVLLTTSMNVYEKRIDPTQAAMWFGLLADFELADIRRALSDHMRDTKAGQFAPKPADIIRHIAGTASDAAAVAWDSLVNAIRRHGHTSSVVFSDPVIHAVVSDMGGWRTACGWLEDDLPFRARDFAERYAARKGNAGNYPPVLAGMDPVPVLVGPRDACERTMKAIGRDA